LNKPTGAPKGNRNNLRSGLAHEHRQHGYLATGRLPKGASYVAAVAKRLRRSLEAAVLARDPRVEVYAAALIQSACRHEIRALLSQKWMRDKEDLTSDQALTFLREISLATDARDKCLRALGLDRPPDAWRTVLDGQVASSDDDPDSDPDPPAPGPPAPAAAIHQAADDLDLTSTPAADTATTDPDQSSLG